MRLFKIRTLRFAFMTLGYRVLLDYFYVTYIVRYWSYMGLYLEVDRLKVMVSYLCLFVFIFFLPLMNEKKISHFIVVLLFYTMYIPLGTIFSLANKSNSFFLMATGSFLMLTFFVVALDSKTPEFRSSGGIVVPKFSTAIYLMSFFVFLVMTRYNIKNIDLASVMNLTLVYEVRRGASYPWGMNYFFSWQTKVLNPYLIATNFKNGEKRGVIIYSAFQLWLYILTGHKLVLFILIVTWAIMIFTNRLEYLPNFMSKGFLVLFALCAFELLLDDRSYILDLFLRRILYLPALISNHYYDFFSSHGFQYWSYSMFGRVLAVNTDFTVQPPYIIGRFFFGNPNAFAVSGFLGTEYMNGGVLGVLLASFGMVAVCKAIDRLSGKLEKDLILITLIAPIYTLWNTGMLTALLTGGVILSLLLLSQTKVCSISGENAKVTTKP